MSEPTLKVEENANRSMVSPERSLGSNVSHFSMKYRDSVNTVEALSLLRSSKTQEAVPKQEQRGRSLGSSSSGEDPVPQRAATELPTNYKGFHSRPKTESEKQQTVPPLKLPIKPGHHRLKKPLRKPSSLFGKLLNASASSSRRESQASQGSLGSQGSTGSNSNYTYDQPGNGVKTTRKSDPSSERKESHHLFLGRHFSTSNTGRGTPRNQRGLSPFSSKFPELSQEMFSSNSGSHSGGLTTERSSPTSRPAEGGPLSQIANIDLTDFSDIGQLVSSVNLKDLANKHNSIAGSAANTLGSAHNEHNASVSSNWVAPESWNVKGDDVVEKERINSTSSSNSSTLQFSARHSKSRGGSVDISGANNTSGANNNTGSVSPNTPKVAEFSSPTQAESGHRSSTSTSGGNSVKKNSISSPSVQRAFIRIFTEDNSSKVMPCDSEMTTAELLRRYKKKYLFNSSGEYQLCVRIGRLAKILDLSAKPLRLQMSLLLLSGYKSTDVTPATDISYLVKFTIERSVFRQLSDEEENIITRDYQHVNLAGFQIQSIPLVLFQRTFDIESLDVSRNPSISIPLDFIQACNNLTKFVYSDNRATSLPLNILQASRLTELNLAVNFLTEIPKSIEMLSNLVSLNLACNQLSSLPKSFGKLKNLVKLNLSSNNFKTYPESVSSLVNLVDLNLSYNSLTTVSPSIVNLTKLENLNISANLLAKETPAFFSQMTSLKLLDIRFNKITDPESISSLPNLQVLKSTSNSIASMKDNLPNLRTFFMDRNPMTSLVLQTSFESLTVVDLSRAKLTTLSRRVFSNISNLERLTLDNNDLISLPKEISRLKKLVYFSAYHNKLQELPEGFGALSSLQYLDLHLNNLKSLPDEIWNLSSLAVLNISSNLLVEFPRPPEEYFQSKAATPVNMSERNSVASGSRNNSISSVSPLNSRRPTEIANIKQDTSEQFLSDSLLFLSLSDNRFDDQNIQVLSLFTRLKSLNLSYNELIELPAGSLHRMNNLADLFLSGNKLTTLPAEDFEGLQSLSTLHLNGNKLHSLPAELSKITHLNVLDVGSNQLKYNISNWPYDWNWHWNTDLKYLNFSGNKRLEIKPSHNRDSSFRDLDSFLVLKDLKILGLMDVTITTQKLPDQTVDTRVRTTPSRFANIGYGISDSLGTSDAVSIRDVVLEKFRGDDGILIGIFDGKNGDDQSGHKISKIVQDTIAIIFQEELKQANSTIEDALRRTLLNLNRDINSIIIKNDTSSFASVPEAHRTSTSYELTPRDGLSGTCATIIYIKDKKIYTANIGDSMAMLTRTNGSYQLLTNEHLPYSLDEYKRIRESGGFVTSGGKLDGIVDVSRAIGFCNLLPHIHAGPDITVLELSPSDQLIAIGTNEIWKHVPYNVAVDLIRKDKGDPQAAAEKLRDYAISYGASDKVAAVIISLNNDQNKLLKRKTEETDALLKVRKDRSSLPEDSTLRRLEDEIEPPVGEVAMVFTDIKSSTLLWDNHPVAMRSAIRTHNTIMRRQLRIVGGYEVKTEGDAFIVSFPTITAALLWCFTVQEQLLEADWPSEILESNQCCEIRDENNNVVYKGLSVRMGAHFGAPVCERDIITKRMDYFGPMVNRTSRISGIADGGQLFLSSDFMKEFNQILECHTKAKSMDLLAAYGESLAPIAAKVDQEMNNLEEIGWVIRDIGEKKLKGLETPENITLMFTRSLVTRLKFYEDDQDAEKAAASVSSVTNTDLVWRLRTLALRLEEVVSYLSEGISKQDRGEENFVKSSDEISSKMSGIGFLTFLDHVITRFEALTNMIDIRQRLGITGTASSDDVMKMLISSLSELSELRQLHGVSGNSQ